MLEALQYDFFLRALAAGILASVVCGVVGTYVVVKQISSVSGGLSHAAFGGVGIGYFFGFEPILGAVGFSLVTGFGMGFVYRRLRHTLDSLISMIWAVGMAVGILFVALTPGYAPDLISYLFGSLLFVPPQYLVYVAVLDLAVLVIVFLFFKELQAVAVDEEFAEIRGIPVERVLHLLLALVSLAVVTLIRVVGTILAIALFTIPAATARQWSDSLRTMMVLASAIGVACTVAGLFLAFWLSESFGLALPTGPLIILLATAVYGASTVFRSWPRQIRRY